MSAIHGGHLKTEERRAFASLDWTLGFVGYRVAVRAPYDFSSFQKVVAQVKTSEEPSISTLLFIHALSISSNDFVGMYARSFFKLHIVLYNLHGHKTRPQS